MSALSTFLESKKITVGSLLAASNRLETRTPEDHALVLARVDAKKNKKEGAAPIAKPKSGRGVSKKIVDVAVAGGAITKRARAKILRAASHLVVEKKKEAAPTMKDVFGDEPAKKGESKGKKDAKK
jgi:hypothetical protein